MFQWNGYTNVLVGQNDFFYLEREEKGLYHLYQFCHNTSFFIGTVFKMFGVWLGRSKQGITFSDPSRKVLVEKMLIQVLFCD